MDSATSDPLSRFQPAVQAWFRATHGEPSPPQRLGWPLIAEGRNTLILAPTGSGKTLAAFLAAIDHLLTHPSTRPGVRILYLSPLKALNEDIARNLEGPLAGIEQAARELGTPMPRLRHAVRTGDTPPAVRQAIARRPPDILITTPESLHLLLGSRARSILTTVSHVIVDEIHALCPNKRGVFLSLLMERLEPLTSAEFVRVGLSATQRPLDVVARYLGGYRKKCSEDGQHAWEPRSVAVVDTGQRKKLDLRVEFPIDRAPTGQAEGSAWPGIERTTLELIRQHASTVVFANNRRVVERLTSRLNEANDEGRADSVDGANGDGECEPVIRSHHGSLSLEQRRSTEQSLKEGRLAAVVATASLELGIDMGAVDLVCQVESPGSVARGLQRVGRAGHVVGQSSKGRLFAKTRGDLLESAALARAMVHGEVEELRVPMFCLDLLAQQVVACVANGPCDVMELFDLFQGSASFQGLPLRAFEATLEMVSGRLGLDFYRDLRPRISWDRVHNRLEPLPGTSSLAMTGGGAIPDTGQFAVTIGQGGPRIGELDEEFVLERRVGDTFLLGTSAWKIDAIDPDRVIVSSASPSGAVLPFWRGENAGRTLQLGEEVGRLCRLVRERMDDPTLVARLIADYHVEPDAARTIIRHVQRQLRMAGAVPDDRTMVVESFRDPAGEWMLAILSPFGTRFHQALKLVAASRVRDRLGVTPASIHADDGVLLRLPGVDEVPLDLLDGLDADSAEEALRAEMMDSAGFGLRFRQNAARAILMPRPQPGKRTPLWLQRLRARDLLQIARKVPDFPIVAETMRECLIDDLELPRFRELMGRISGGQVEIVKRLGETPSPFATELMLPFTLKYLYEWDEPKRADRGTSAEEERRSALLDALMDPILRAEALEDADAEAANRAVERRLRGLDRPPRDAAETSEWLRRVGDVAASEIPDEVAPWLEVLRADGRAGLIRLDEVAEPDRWVLTEEFTEYAHAFGSIEGPVRDEARGRILRRFLSTRVLVGLDEVVARYPMSRMEAREFLESWAEEGGLARVGRGDDGESEVWADLRNLTEARRANLRERRSEVRPVSPESFARFVLHRQRLTARTTAAGAESLDAAMDQLRGRPLTAEAWESEVLPARVLGYSPAMLDGLLGSGRYSWMGTGDDSGRLKVAFVDREAPRSDLSSGDLEAGDRQVLERLRDRGAAFVADLAVELRRSPSSLYGSLDVLASRGLASNDGFEPLRASGRARRTSVTESAVLGSGPAASRRRSRMSLGDRAEGRWYAVVPTAGTDEERLAWWVLALLDRYGVLCREIAAMEPLAPPWRELVPWLDRAEWRGEVRRGYFVEGMSGLQFASPEAPDELRATEEAPELGGRAVMISAVDPANLYGSGAPFDVPLLESGTARLPRNESTHLVIAAGRPVLLIESNGRRLTRPGGASDDEFGQAVGLLSRLAGPGRRVLRVETIDGTPAWNSPAAPILADHGFVREPPNMSLYVGWS